MSFRDNYQFVGASIPRQIGNAVPPLMAKAVGEHVLKLLGRRQKLSQEVLDLGDAGRPGPA